MTEAPSASSENKNQMSEVLIDKLGVESLYIINTSSLALYAKGKTTGTVVDIEFQTTFFVTIYEEFVLNHAVTKVDTGGKDLTVYFCLNIDLRSDNDKFVNERQIYDK